MTHEPTPATMGGPRLVALAEQIATDAHAGQTDKAGNPYITHPARVAAKCEQAYGDPKTVMVAWLHDVVEDTPVTLDDLLEAGFPEDVVQAVAVITHRLNEPRLAYYDRVRRNPLALLVKLADIADNADPERLALIDDETTRERLRVKYVNALNALGRTRADLPQ